MVRNEAVDDAALDHVLGDIAVQSVHERRFHGTHPIEPCGRLKLAAVEEALRQRAVDLLADAAALSVDHVAYRRAARQCHPTQVSESVIVIGGRGAGAGLRLERAIRLVRIGATRVANQAVLIVVRGRGG